MFTHTTRTLTKNQIARLARKAAEDCSPQKRELSTEPISEFALVVEKRAFKDEKHTKNSIVYHTTGESFPYLQHFANEVDFGLLTPAQIAAIYVTARSGRRDWHIIAAQPDAANYTPSEYLVEQVNGYFEAAQEPQSSELHEMHQMFETFMRPSDRDKASFGKLQSGERIQTVAFFAAANLHDTSSIREALESDKLVMPQARAVPDDKTCALIFRTFTQQTTWFSRQ